MYTIIPKSLMLVCLMITATFAGCLGANERSETEEREKLIIAFEVKDDYTSADENPQILADYLSEALDMDIKLYPIDSEGATLQALRFGNADIAFMDGAAAWVGWQQYGLDALAADQKSDGRTYYSAHAVVRADSDIANAHFDGNNSTDPFTLLEGKTSCHTGWLKSAGMLLPMGFLIGNGYVDVVGDVTDIDSLRDTITSYFDENSSIPESGTPYYSYSGALKCLSEGVGDVAFVKDSTVPTYCGNDNSSENQEWCLDSSEYVLLPSYGNAPSHPVMYNPSNMDAELVEKIQAALIGMKDTEAGAAILENVLNTPAISETTAQEHLSSYGNLIEDVPGISSYFNDKFLIVE